MNVVDSSAWLAYFADEPNAQHFASAIEAPDSLIAPSITLLEVFKKVALQYCLSEEIISESSFTSNLLRILSQSITGNLNSFVLIHDKMRRALI